MISHYNMCSYTPPVCAAPSPPAVPAGTYLTLYNVSDVLFKDKKPSCSRASRSKLKTPVTSSSAMLQRELQDVNQDSTDTHPFITTQKTSPPSTIPRSGLQYVNQDSTDNKSFIATQKTKSPSGQPQLSGGHVSHRPPIAPRRKFPSKQKLLYTYLHMVAVEITL